MKKPKKKTKAKKKPGRVSLSTVLNMILMELHMKQGSLNLSYCRGIRETVEFIATRMGEHLYLRD